MTITAIHTDAAITTESNLQRRSIKFTTVIEERDGYSVRLSMTVQHNDKGRYLVTVWRESYANGFVTVSIMEDRARGEYITRGGRYSAKNLEALAAEQINVFKQDIQDLGAWARELTKR